MAAAVALITLQVTQLVGYVGTLPSVQFEYTGEHGRVDRKGWQSGLQGTVCMSKCESIIMELSPLFSRYFLLVTY